MKSLSLKNVKSQRTEKRLKIVRKCGKSQPFSWRATRYGLSRFHIFHRCFTYLTFLLSLLALNIIGVLEAIPKLPINKIVIRIKARRTVLNALGGGHCRYFTLLAETRFGFWVRSFWLVSDSKFPYKLHPSDMKSDSSKRAVVSIFHMIVSDQT